MISDMEQAFAEAEVEKLRNKPQVESAEIKVGDKGVFIEVTPEDRTSMHELRGELHKFNVWIELKEP